MCLPATARAGGRFLQSTSEYLIQVWETGEGMPENSATSMAQTPDGYLWFGTFNGLVRFNGIEMQVFDRSTLPGLPSSAIVNVYCDRLNRLWLSTDRGLGYVENDRWHDVGADKGWKSELVKTFAESPNGPLVIMAHDGRIYEADGSQLREVAPPLGFASNTAFACYDSEGTLWLGSMNFFGCRTASGWERRLPLEEGRFFAGAASPTNGLWLLSSNYLCHWDQGKIQRRWPVPRRFHPWSCTADRRGNFWIATYDEGVYRLNPEGKIDSYTSPQHLAFNGARFVFEDREGLYWIGTSGGGLHQFSPRKFHAYSNGSKTGLLAKSLCEMQPGEFYLATFGDGLYRLGPEGLNLDGIPLRKNATGSGNAFPHDFLATLAKDSQGRLWIGSYGGGLYIWDGQALLHPTNGLSASLRISGLFRDQQQRMWIGTTSGLFSSSNGVDFVSYGAESGLEAKDIRCFAEAPGTGILWLGSNDKGLFAFQNGRFHKYGASDGLNCDQIHTMHMDPLGNLWFGGPEGGLFRRDPQGRFGSVSAAQNLPLRQISCILEDAIGYLWLGYNQGIMRVRKSELEDAMAGRTTNPRFQLFDVTDGMPSTDVASGFFPTGTCDTRGRLWFGTARGLAMIDPADQDQEHAAPPVNLEEFTFHEPVPASRRLSTAPAAAEIVRTLAAPFPDQYVMAAGSHQLEFKYAALCYRNPAKIQYQTQLEGYDAEWINMKNRRQAYYHDLPPGNYRFRVRATNSDGLWNETGDSLAFTIEPFFWQTWWFRFGALLVFGGGIAASAWSIQHNHLKHRLESLRQQEALASERARASALAQNASDMVLLMDERMVVTYESPSTTRILGYPPGHFVGKRHFDSLHPEDQERMKAAFQGMIQGVAHGPLKQFRCRHANGSWVTLEALATNLTDNPLIEAIMITARDVSDRVQSELQLRLLSAAVEQSPDPVVITGPEGKIEYVNPAFTRLTGYLLEEAVGRTPRILKSGQTPAETYKSLWSTITTGQQWSGQFINRKKSGETYWESAIISPIKDHSGRLTHFLATKKDISALKQAEEVKAKLEARLKHSEKMESLGTLAGGIAHDFNNILSAIVGFTELARLDAQEHPEILENLLQVAKASSRARDLVQQILSFSRHQRKDRQPVRLQPIVAECLKLIRSTLPAAITIETSIQEAPLMAMADATQIHQVIMNLCANAAHAMRGQAGRLVVGLANFDSSVETNAAMPDLPPGQYARLWVGDSGHGMPPEILKRIFDPFFTTKEPGEGTGLGLAVVHGIVRDHEGIVLVDSQVGVGTTFQIFLPLCAEAEPIAFPEPTQEVPPGNGQKILFVDDEPALCQSAQKLLQRWGYQPVCHTHPEDALADFREQPDSFELVITDLSMPGMSGIDFASAIIKLRPDMPIILASGFMGQWTENIALQAGIREIIIKPISPYNLGLIINRALRAKQPVATA